MIQNPIDVLEKFPVRKSKEQKATFITAVTDYAQSLRYAVNVETGKRGARNIVIGDPQNARYLITAHYDTPASIGLPNIITPNNLFTFILIQILLVSILLAVSVGAAALVYAVSKADTVALLTWYVVYFGLVILLREGPANPHNANDNTSGVVTVLETLASMPENTRRHVCFVLFDLEEAGLIGSASYRKMHKSATEQQIVLNLDCVGDGDIIQLTPVKKAKKDQALLNRLAGICGSKGEKELRLRSKGFNAGSSDHRSFPFGVGLMAFRRKKGIGLYCDRIHTWRDTILDQTNVNLLRDALITFVSETAL